MLSRQTTRARTREVTSQPTRIHPGSVRRVALRALRLWSKGPSRVQLFLLKIPQISAIRTRMNSTTGLTSLSMIPS